MNFRLRTSRAGLRRGMPPATFSDMSRVICFGELLIRLSSPGHTLLTQAPALQLHVGGAEANVAVALACLGHPARMVSAVPDNPLGRRAVEFLRAHGVDCDAVQVRPGRMGLYLHSPGAGLRPAQILYDRAGSAFATAPPDSFDWDRALEGARRLHISGVTAAVAAGPAQAALHAARAAQARGVALSFDCNFRASLWASRGVEPRSVLTPLIEPADVLFGNHRDASLLLGRAFPGENPQERREAALALFAAFPGLRLIASTLRRVDSADCHRIAARIDTRDGEFETAQTPLSGIVERIGAGDAFAAGVLHALAADADLRHIAETGLALACLKHFLPGDASTLTEAELRSACAGGLDVRR